MGYMDQSVAYLNLLSRIAGSIGVGLCYGQIHSEILLHPFLCFGASSLSLYSTKHILKTEIIISPANFSIVYIHNLN